MRILMKDIDGAIGVVEVKEAIYAQEDKEISAPSIDGSTEWIFGNISAADAEKKIRELFTTGVVDMTDYPMSCVEVPNASDMLFDMLMGGNSEDWDDDDDDDDGDAGHITGARVLPWPER